MDTQSQGYWETEQFLLKRGVTGIQLKYFRLGRSMGKRSSWASEFSLHTRRLLHIKLIASSLKINKYFPNTSVSLPEGATELKDWAEFLIISWTIKH